MKTAAFHELLESFRGAGAYFEGSRKTVIVAGRIAPKKRSLGRPTAKRE